MRSDPIRSDEMKDAHLMASISRPKWESSLNSLLSGVQHLPAESRASRLIFCWLGQRQAQNKHTAGRSHSRSNFFLLIRMSA